MCRNRFEKNLKHTAKSVIETPSQTGENLKTQACMSEILQRNEVRRRTCGSDGFPCKLKGEDSFVVNLLRYSG
ncbi:MAG: hypothetical protein ACLUTA_06125 [Blautia wexlerae]